MRVAASVRRWLACHALVVALVLFAAPAAASPWLSPGDARARMDVELLKAEGFITGPVNSWPVAWVEIDAGLERARVAQGLSPAVLGAVSRLGILSDRAQQRARYKVEGRFTNEPSLVRGFGETARNPADITITASHELGDRFSITWGGSWISNGTSRQPATQRGNGFSLAPSEVAIGAGNWIFYGGWIDTQWGPGQDGSLLFSTSARAFPRVGFRTMRAKTINFPVLRWLGPVSFDTFFGQLREKRDFDNPMVIGMRFGFEPVPQLEIGLKRGLMLCGRNRPCSLGTIKDALVGLGNADNTGTPNEPGNQLAGIDLAYRQPLGKSGHALLVTFDTVAEDEDDLVIEQFARQVGVAFTGPAGRDGALYRAGVEYTDTQASKLFGGRTWPGSMYNHFLYRDGWTFDGRPLGYSLDGDAHALTVYGEVTDTRNRHWYGSVRQITLNLNAIPRYRVSHTRERITLVTGGVNWPTEIGDIQLEARLQKNAPDTPDSAPLRGQVELGWTSRF